MTNILKNPRAYATSVLKEESTLSRITTKSHYRSFGPEFYRVLFDFGGQSPLILYYLKVHELVDISSTPKQKKSRLTQILREAPPAPTYRDVIMESKKQLAKNQKDFRMIKQRINEEIKRLRLRQEKIDKEINRLQAKASKNPQEVKTDFENFLHKLSVEEKLEEEFGVSPTPPSSPPSPPSSAASFIAPGD